MAQESALWLILYGMLKDATMGFVSVQTVGFELWVDLYRVWT